MDPVHGAFIGHARQCHDVIGCSDDVRCPVTSERPIRLFSVYSGVQFSLVDERALLAQLLCGLKGTGLLVAGDGVGVVLANELSHVDERADIWRVVRNYVVR